MRAEPAPLKKTERTRRRLLMALREELEEKGDFTGDRVALRAGSSPATFYNHFEGKEDAFDAAYSQLMDELVDQVAAVLRIERVQAAGLQRFASQWVSACIQFFRANQVLFGAAQAKAPVSGSIRQIYEQTEVRAIEACEDFVRRGQSAGLFRTGDARQIARVVMISSEGYHNPAVLAVADDDPLLDELARALCGMLKVEGGRP